jgi:hypothetical protein
VAKKENRLANKEFVGENKMKRLLIISLCVLFVAGTAVAEDLQPPWWRGQWSTTSQVWEFNYEILPETQVLPDGPAPGGQPPLESTDLYWYPGPEPWDEWMAEDMPYEYAPEQWVGRGVVPLSGVLDVLVDNHDPNPENEKWIWLQITWRPQDEGEEPEFWYLDPEPVEPPMLVEEIFLGPDDPLGWRESTYAWELDHNPPDEIISIGGTINVDELVIDTWCVPEPTTIALLGLGSLVLALKKRKA